jgi:predicted double-glycine peptidase
MKTATLFFLMVIVFTGCSGKKGKLLDVSSTRQAFEYSCGPGAVQSVMAYYGSDFRESELINMLKTDKDEGTYVRDIVKFFHYHGFTTQLKQQMTIEELCTYIDRNIPVIALVQAWGSEGDFKKGYLDCWNDGHFVVVIGYTDKLILISDPALYTTGYIPISEFTGRWHDIDEGDIKTYHLGIAVYGKEPTFDKEKFVRIE